MNGDATILNQQPDESRYFGGCTNWAQYSVAQLKYALEEDHQLAWNQVSAWSRTSLLIGEYREIMTQVRDRVASAWNAPPGSAAHEFLTFIDGLISAMIHVEATAVANKSALANLLTTLATTRTRITDLQQQWQKNQDMDDAARASLLEYLPRPPAHWKQDLSNQAMEHMHHMDQQVFSATRLMVVPPTPRWLPEFVDSREPDQSTAKGQGGAGPHAPHIPPPQILPPTDSGGGEPGAGSGGGDTILDGGPSAGGSGSSPTTPVGNPFGLTDGLTAQRDGASSVIGLAPRVNVAVAPNSAAPRFTQRGSVTAPLLTGSVPAERANPVGGLIPPVTGQRGRVSAAGQKPGNEAWAIAEGTPAVLMPDPEPHSFDPGRGVFGVDR